MAQYYRSAMGASALWGAGKGIFVPYVSLSRNYCSSYHSQDPSLKGIFHWSGNEQMTKYEIACAMADAFNLPSSHLRPVSIVRDIYLCFYLRV